MAKLQEVKQGNILRYFICVPKELVNNQGWKKGQEVFLVLNERGNIELAVKKEQGDEK